MVNITKTVGTAATYDPEKINKLLSSGAINNIANLEKAIFSLECLGQLRKASIDFIFKGGSAIQVVLLNKWTRLSVDADICSNATEEELVEVLKVIYQRFNKEMFAFEARAKEIAGSVPFYLYMLKSPPITTAGETRTCLLDVMGVKPNYNTTQVPLKTLFFDSEMTITTPTTGALLGDKLTTIGPNTMGRHLVDSRNGLEYAKHFYDIKNLQETNFNFKDCHQTFCESIKMQSKMRNKELPFKECCDDLLFTCQVASLPQRDSESLIAKLPSQLRLRAASEQRILKDGLKRFQPFLVQKLTYFWDDLRHYAALSALLAKMLQTNIPENKAKTILNTKDPTTRKDIEQMSNKISTIPESKR
jgi:hypothetical protein